MFGTDGHGSVRVLYDLAGVIARDDQQRMQVYFYNAYGNLLSLGGSSLTSNSLPLTTYLYSGEAFDFRIGQQYLRARWYDARTGRFDRLDPFAGNSQDPQSFHKYGYVHNDPIMGVDPTGMFFQQLHLQVKSAAASLAARSATQVSLREIGKRYGWKLAQNFIEWYYIDNHINGTIDALAGFAYGVSGWRNPNVAAVVRNLNAILGTLTAMRRIMKTRPLLLVPLLSANPGYKGSRLEGLVNFYSDWQGKHRLEGRVAAGLIVLGSMPFLVANLNYANTFNNANNETLRFKGYLSPVAMVSRLLLGSAMGTAGNNAFVRTVWLPEIVRSAPEKVKLSPDPQSFAKAT